MGAKTITFVAISMLILALFLGGYYIWSDSQSKKLQQQQTSTIQQTVQQTSTTNPLAGKAATITAFVKDDANDKTGIRAALYLITNPTVGTDNVAGTFAVDATTIATTGTDLTSGLAVGTKYVAIASNNTYFGFPSKELTVGEGPVTDGNARVSGSGQSQTLEIDAYTTASGVSFTIKDKDENTISLQNGGTRNLTLSADEAELLDSIKIEVNQTNAALNLAGFYFDKPASGANISKFEVASGYTGTPGITKGGIALQSTEADDEMYLFNAPIVVKEYGSVEIQDGIFLTADGGGCAGADEIYTIYALDKIWVKSSIGSKMIYAYETDSTTPADVGIANPSVYFHCYTA